jgi:hypothetical protein
LIAFGRHAGIRRIESESRGIEKPPDGGRGVSLLDSSADMLTIRDQQMNTLGEEEPGKAVVQPCENTKTWVEIRLVDADENPVGGIGYRLKLPDSSIREGVLGDDGTARVDGILPGQCEVSFPDIDAREWLPV